MLKICILIFLTIPSSLLLSNLSCPNQASKEQTKSYDLFKYAKPINQNDNKIAAPDDVFRFNVYGTGAAYCVGVNLTFYTSKTDDTTCDSNTVCKSNVTFRGCKVSSMPIGPYGISADTLRLIWQQHTGECGSIACVRMADNSSAATFAERSVVCNGTHCLREDATPGGGFPLGNATSDGPSCGC